MHHRDYPGQPTSHLPREQATPKQAPSGHPTDSTTQRTQRALGRFPHHTNLMRCSATLQAQQQSSTVQTNTRVPPTGHYVPNRSTPASNALTVCTGSRSLRTELVPGQPGLARPPTLQDHKTITPNTTPPRPRTPAPVICLARHPGTSSLNY